MCTEKRAQESKTKSITPKPQFKLTVPTKKGTSSKQVARSIQGSKRNQCERLTAPRKTGEVNQQNARPQQVDGHVRAFHNKSNNFCVNTNDNCNSRNIQNRQFVYSRKAAITSAKSNKIVFQQHGRTHISRKQKSSVADK